MGRPRKVTQEPSVPRRSSGEFMPLMKGLFSLAEFRRMISKNPSLTTNDKRRLIESFSVLKD